MIIMSFFALVIAPAAVFALSDQLELTINKAELSLERTGQMKEKAGGLEISNTRYAGTGEYRIRINDDDFTAKKLKVSSNLKFKNNLGEHKGMIDIEVDTDDNLVLQYKGSAKKDGLRIESTGKIDVSEATGIFVGMTWDQGTYSIRITESGSDVGSPAIITITKAGSLPDPSASAESDSSDSGKDSSNENSAQTDSDSSGQTTGGQSSSATATKSRGVLESIGGLFSNLLGFVFKPNEASKPSATPVVADSKSSGTQTQQQSQNTNQFKGDGIVASFSEGKDNAEIRIKNEGAAAITVISVDVSGPQKVTAKNCIGEIAPKKELRCTALGTLDPNDEHKATISIKMPDSTIKRIVLVA